MSEPSSPWQNFLFYYAVPITTIGAAIILVLEHRIRPRPVRVIIEPSDHDLRCGCRNELAQIHGRLDTFWAPMARNDGIYEENPYHRAQERVYRPGDDRAALGGPAV